MVKAKVVHGCTGPDLPLPKCLKFKTTQSGKTIPIKN